MIATGRFAINSTLIKERFPAKEALTKAQAAMPGLLMRYEKARFMPARSGWNSTLWIYWIGDIASIKAAREALDRAFDREEFLDFVKTTFTRCTGRFSRAVLPTEVEEAVLYQIAPINADRPEIQAFIADAVARWGVKTSL